MPIVGSIRSLFGSWLGGIFAPGITYPRPTITSITPTTGYNNGSVSVTITGTNFYTPAVVKLIRTGETDITASSVVVVSTTTITCVFDLTSVALGYWGLSVSNRDATSTILPWAFYVLLPEATLLNPIIPDNVPLSSISPPEWFAIRDKSTGRTSLLWKVINTISQVMDKVDQEKNKKYGTHLGLGDGFTETQKAWTILVDRDIDTMEFISAGSATVITETFSMNELLSSTLPTYLRGDNSLVILKNLDVIELPLQTSGTEFTLPDCVNDDEPVVIYSYGDWIEFPYSRIDGLDFGASGQINTRLHTEISAAYITGSCIRINGDQLITPERVDLWNTFDELGLPASVDRIEYETNSDYLERIETLYSILPSDPNYIVQNGIAIRIGSTKRVEWDGESTISVSESGDIYNAQVVSYPLIQKNTEALQADDTKTSFYSAKRDWYGDPVVYLNDARLYEFSALSPVTTGGIVEFPQECQALVSATYSYLSYDLAIEGNTLTLSPNDNTEIGEYYLVYNVDVYTLGLSEDNFTDDELSNLTKSLRGVSPILMGDARWSRNATWVTEATEAPPLSHISVELE